MPSNELKPCPFCGARAYVHRKILRASVTIWYVCLCEECPCQTWGSDNMQEAIEAWNRRAGEQEQ